MSDHLATYLNDHLSGSTAALELLEHLEQAHPDLTSFLKQLRHDIEFDRKELEGLMTGLGVSQSSVRQAAAWVVEKFARLKLKVDDLSGSRLKLLESLEAIAIGVHGKGSLWRALAAASVPGLTQADYDRLAARADEQRQRIEPVRLDAARAALGA
jgi:hypothetical protein